jgi:asparagine synthetase B (glutamine-hydrolysing)
MASDDDNKECISILFSGGLDSTIIAYLICEYYYQDRHRRPICIELINVAFYDKDREESKTVLEGKKNKIVFFSLYRCSSLS